VACLVRLQPQVVACSAAQLQRRVEVYLGLPLQQVAACSEHQPQLVACLAPLLQQAAACSAELQQQVAACSARSLLEACLVEPPLQPPVVACLVRLQPQVVACSAAQLQPQEVYLELPLQQVVVCLAERHNQDSGGLEHNQDWGCLEVVVCLAERHNQDSGGLEHNQDWGCLEPWGCLEHNQDLLHSWRSKVGQIVTASGVS